MILEDVNGQGFVAYSPAYVAQVCKLPVAQMYLTEKWFEGVRPRYFLLYKEDDDPREAVLYKSYWGV